MGWEGWRGEGQWSSTCVKCDFIWFFCQMKSLMVIGIDTYHDSASKGRSAGGFIASMNATLTR